MSQAVGIDERIHVGRIQRLRRLLAASALGGSVLAFPAVLLLLAAFLAIIVILVGYSFGFFDARQTVGIDIYQGILTDGFTRGVILSTLRLAFTVTLVTLVIGYPLAWIIVRSGNRTRSILTGLVVGPLLINAVVRTLGWLVILSPNGVVNSVLPGDGIDLLGNMVGVTIGLTHVFLPFMVLPLIAVIENIRPELGEAAVVHGGHPIVAFVRVLLPLTMPGIVAGGTLVFLLSAGSLVTPALLGLRRVWVLSTLIYQQVALGLWGKGAALAITLFVISLTVVRVSGWVGDRLTGKGARSTKGRLGGAVQAIGVAIFSRLRALPEASGLMKRLRVVYTILVASFILLPLVMVLKSSFDASGKLWAGFGGFTLKYYRSAFESGLWVESFLLSARVALSAVAIGLLIGIPAAWAVVRGTFPGRGPLLSFLLSPLAVPHLVMGLGYLLYFQVLAFRPGFGRLLLVHVIIVLPFVIRTVVSALQGLDERLEESARTLGATTLVTFRRVILPLTKPAAISAALFAFLVSLDEVTVTLFVAGAGQQPLAVRMYGSVVHDVFNPEVTAVSTMLIAVSVVTLLILGRSLGYSHFVARER